MEELEQLRKDFNNNIIKILENNKSTYLEEAQIDGFYTETSFQMSLEKLLIN